MDDETFIALVNSLKLACENNKSRHDYIKKQIHFNDDVRSLHGRIVVDGQVQLVFDEYNQVVGNVISAEFERDCIERGLFKHSSNYIRRENNYVTLKIAY
jgi:hypothetical protein